MRPPRKKPGEEDPDAPIRKGRCLIREDDSYTPKPALANVDKPKAKPEPTRTQKSSDYRLINDIRVSKNFFWVTASALGLILIASIGVPVFQVLRDAPDRMKTAEAETEPSDSTSVTTEPGIQASPLRDSYQELKSAALRRIDEPKSKLEEILIANAEITGMANARTCSAEGTAIANGRQYDLNFFAKAPNLLRQVLTLDDLKITSVYNGTAGKLEAMDYTKKRSVERDMTQLQDLTILMSSLPNLPIWQYEADSTKISDGGQQIYEGELYYVVVNRGIHLFEIMHYFDIETSLERVRRATVISDDQELSITVKFSEYQQIGQFYTPMEINVLEESAVQVVSKILVEKWSFNQGLLPSLFSLDNS
ncbi:hypothetical protein [Cerasicoccus arenae]|uniref:Uncharacterized protein n=1 Tax=Cerasicoccus arenae TaxID=424488 RepID=A0A8J3DGH6_9BACT|nr:hypothetical protein [Cerasicoccus arenae]MBK1858826.1 hypothetical protein [Cerasicoccus arenae]GHC04374.1 hypothetical protein GCM10007047_21370 [Cerasicoccus arenae]